MQDKLIARFMTVLLVASWGLAGIAEAQPDQAICLAIDVSRSLKPSEFKALCTRSASDAAQLPNGTRLRVLTFGDVVDPPVHDARLDHWSRDRIVRHLESLAPSQANTEFSPVLDKAGSWFATQETARRVHVIYSDGVSDPRKGRRDVAMAAALAGRHPIDTVAVTVVWRPRTRNYVLVGGPGAEVGTQFATLAEVLAYRTRRERHDTALERVAAAQARSEASRPVKEALESLPQGTWLAALATLLLGCGLLVAPRIPPVRAWVQAHCSERTAEILLGKQVKSADPAFTPPDPATVCHLSVHEPGTPRTDDVLVPFPEPGGTLSLSGSGANAVTRGVWTVQGLPVGLRLSAEGTAPGKLMVTNEGTSAIKIIRPNSFPIFCPAPGSDFVGIGDRIETEDGWEIEVCAPDLHVRDNALLRVVGEGGPS